MTEQNLIVAEIPLGDPRVKNIVKSELRMIMIFILYKLRADE